MKLAVGVHDHGDAAWAAGAAFDEWDAAEASRTWLSRAALGEKPARGQPDLRLLPCLLALLREHALAPDVIVLDGLVHLDAAETPAFGRGLYDALGGRVAVVGVSTRSVPGLSAQYEVFREEEARPVIVTCAGMDIGAAKVKVRAMHGRRRMPTLLKLAGRIARGGGVD